MTTSMVFAVVAMLAAAAGSPTSSGDCVAEAERVLSRGAAEAPPVPSWVEPGMPQEVWWLVEASTEAREQDLSKCLLEAAEAEARRSLEGGGDPVSLRFALAVVLGLRADRNGGRTKVRAAAALHVELRRVLELDPSHARARHILGRLHAGVMRMDGFTRWIATNLMGGGPLKEATWEEAERNLAEAEARAPEVSEHHYELARLYQDTHRLDLAAMEVEHVLALEATSPMELDVLIKALALERDLEEKGS